MQKKDAKEKDELKEIGDRVRMNGKVLTVSTTELRDASGAQRLGKNVAKGIYDQLLSTGIGVFPSEEGIYSRDSVRLYVLGSEVDHLIRAVQNPDEAGDQQIRDALGGRATEILNEIRVLVCE